MTRQRIFIETMERYLSNTDKIIIDQKSGVLCRIYRCPSCRRAAYDAADAE